MRFCFNSAKLIEIGSLVEQEAMFRRSRGFSTTVFILITIVLFGYGLYMYDLQSLRLTEAEAKNKKLERNLNTAQSDMKSESSKRTKLEKMLEKEKHEHQQKTLTLKLESEERDKREKEAIAFGEKFSTAKNDKEECLNKLDRMEKDFKVIKDESNAQALSMKTLEQSAVECQRQQGHLNEQIHELQNANQELLSNVDSATHSKDEILENLYKKQGELQEEAEDNKSKYHQSAEELIELKDALNNMGIEGLKRDSNWADQLSVEERSIILQGILDTDMIPDSLIAAEPTPEIKVEHLEESIKDPEPIDNQNDAQIVVPDDGKKQLEKLLNIELKQEGDIQENNIQPPNVDTDKKVETDDKVEDKADDGQPKIESPVVAGDIIRDQNEM